MKFTTVKDYNITWYSDSWAIQPTERVLASTIDRDYDLNIAEAYNKYICNIRTTQWDPRAARRSKQFISNESKWILD